MPPEQRLINKRNCPVCTRATINAKGVMESEKIEDAGLWYLCSCGVIFNSEFLVAKPKTKAYIKKYQDFKEYEFSSKEPARVYGPLIEELTMGRKMLDVGFCTQHNMNAFKERGWVTFGIDNNKDIKATDRLFNDNFETTDKLYQKTYDLVWMSHVLEKLRDPLSAIYKVREVLQDNGVLYIATPDTDFLYSKPVNEWTHWNKKENHIFWNTRALTRELERIGFQVVMQRRNYCSRWGFYHNIHLVCQKIYF